MLSIAILDDNMSLLEEYERLVPAWFGKNNIEGRIVVATTDYKVFLNEVSNQIANVCIIDINLKCEVNGLYIAKCLRRDKIHTEIIFCTGMLEYMSQAFDVSAYNFVIKPVGRNLEKCLIKLNRELEARESSKRTLEIKLGSHIYYVPIDSITHLQRKGSKTLIHTTNRVLEIYDSLEALCAQLNDERFVKCHRATVVNKEFIDFIDKKTKKLILTSGYSCELGTKYFTSLYIKKRSDSNVV